MAARLDRGPLVLLPRACGAGDLRLGTRFQEADGSIRGFDLRFTNVSGSRCWLGGMPEVRAGFHRQVRVGAPATHVVLAAGRSAWSFVGTRRCEDQTVGPVRTVTVRLVALRTSTRIRVPVGGLTRCSGQPANRLLGVTAVSARRSLVDLLFGHPSDHVAVEVHTPIDPRVSRRPVPTYGRADLDGDGQPDLVVVDPSGMVTATIRGRSVRAHIPADTTTRLQALPDLVGNGTHEILVATTALASDEGYRFSASGSLLLRLHDGGLGVVVTERGRPLTLAFDHGTGDLYAGLRCDAGPTEVSTLFGPHRSTVRATGLRLDGLTARLTPLRHVTEPTAAAIADASSDCPGMDRYGWSD